MKAKFEIEVEHNTVHGDLIVVKVDNTTVIIDKVNNPLIHSIFLSITRKKWEEMNLTEIDVTGMNKGQIMNIAYKNDKVKLNAVDVALPNDYTKDKPHTETFWFVMDYNTNKIFGEIVDLRNIAHENGLKLVMS